MQSRRLPAEWEPQSGVLLTWPHPHGDWRNSLDTVEAVFTHIASEIAQRETLVVVCYDRSHRQHIREVLGRAGVDGRAVRYGISPSNDAWARDHAPLTVLDKGRPVLLDFLFNGWGGKYPYARDNAVSRALATQGVFATSPMISLDLVLEGGSIDSDGHGTLLTTPRCLLHPARNPGMQRPRLRQLLQEHLGISRIHWLQHGALAGDDTDGHIDMLARFAARDTLLYQACDERDYPYFDDLQAMRAELESLTCGDGKPYRLLALPWPGPKYNPAGQRLPASYANFLILNAAVLVPTYEDRADDAACDVIQSAFPDRTVVAVNCRPLIEQYGSLHCVTMQFPAAVELAAAG